MAIARGVPVVVSDLGALPELSAELYRELTTQNSPTSPALRRWFARGRRL